MNVVQEHNNKDKESRLSIWSLALEQIHQPSCLLRNSTEQGEFTMNTFGVGVNEVE